MKVLICGQKRFGRDVAELILSRPGWSVVAASCPVRQDNLDKLHILALNLELPVIPSGQLNADAVDRVCEGGVDLIVAAHCHDFIGRKTRHRSRLGALGYHPSLLPRHRGRSNARRHAPHHAGHGAATVSERVAPRASRPGPHTQRGGPALQQADRGKGGRPPTN